MLTPSSTVTGTVRDENGRPVTGVEVTAYGADNRNLSRDGKTDEQGRFRIVGMYACDYVLSIDGREIVDSELVRVRPLGSAQDVGVVTVKARD